MGRLVLGSNINTAREYIDKGNVIYVDNPVEVIKEILLPPEEKIIYQDRIIEVLVPGEPVEIEKIIEVEKIVYVDRPVVEEKIVYKDKIIVKEKIVEVASEPKIVNVPITITKTVYKVSANAWIMMAVEAALIILLLIVK